MSIFNGTVNRRSVVRSLGLGGLATAAVLATRPLGALASDPAEFSALRDQTHARTVVQNFLTLIGGDADARHEAWNTLSVATQRGEFLGDEENFMAKFPYAATIHGWPDGPIHPELAQNVTNVEVALTGAFALGGLFRIQFMVEDFGTGNGLQIAGWNLLDPLTLIHPTSNS